ncbi:MAG: SDR family oxidoreductase [Chloroflexi bacterium]|nr:MAG: SDR family oxidoreductase [Chloroflexota bacterium]
MTRLRGHAAFVTGAARGIGGSIAARLAAEGAAVVVADVDEEAGRQAAEKIATGGATAVAAALDVRDAEAVAAAMTEASARFGKLDILVNNAGVFRDRRLEEMSDSDWDTVLDIDLRGYFVCCRAALPHLRASGWGRIVNISSRAYLGNPGQVNYSAAKAGVIGLTRALSMELGRDGITVNAVAPGMIDTPLVRSHAKADEVIARAVASTPLRRIGTPEDVAAAVAFLVSDDAAYITGDVIHVTGGRYG